MITITQLVIIVGSSMIPVIILSLLHKYDEKLHKEYKQKYPNIKYKGYFNPRNGKIKMLPSHVQEEWALKIYGLKRLPQMDEKE